MKRLFGKMPDGKEVYLIELTYGALKANIITYGASIQSFKLPYGDGQELDIVLGFDRLEDYLLQNKCFGCVVGRCTNRISNGRFELNGHSYNLYKNSAGNSSHGGKVGFGKRVWDIDEITDSSVRLHLFSPDMDENYPGDLDIYVKYSLTATSLKIEYFGHSNKDTIVNLTNHAYFNIEGHDAGDIGEQLISINANYFTWANEKTVPDGRIISVESSPMDLRELQPFNKNIDSSYDQIKWSKGFDRNWCINGKDGEIKKAATIISKKTNLQLEVFTSQPGLQLYTANFLSGGPRGKGNVEYVNRGAYALETQGYPDAINHKNFPSVVLRAGQEYREVCEYRISGWKMENTH